MPDHYPAGHFRLFVAIALPEPVRAEIIRTQQELRRLAPGDAVRWTRPEQFHLTLRFLGNVSGDAVDGLQQSVAAVCRKASPLALSAQGVGFFPNPRSPRVIWVGVKDPGNRLIDFQTRIEAAVAPFSPEGGEKNFTGHVTLGRLKSPRPGDVQGLSAAAQWFDAKTFGEWTAQQVEIIRSELSAGGARYTPLAVFRLGAENV